MRGVPRAPDHADVLRGAAGATVREAPCSLVALARGASHATGKEFEGVVGRVVGARCRRNLPCRT
eukprot:11171728-Lingulodinium_polyedra.AAC.1